jgi:hypothetical protein
VGVVEKGGVSGEKAVKNGLRKVLIGTRHYVGFLLVRTVLVQGFRVHVDG